MDFDAEVTRDHERRNWRSGLLLVLCGLPLTAGGVLMMLKPSPDKPEEFLIGLGCIVMFGGATLLGFSRLFAPRGMTEEVDTRAVVTISQSRWKAILVGLVSAAAAVAGGMLAAHAPDGDGSLKSVIAIYGLLIGGSLGAVATGYRFVTGQIGPLYDVGPKGIQFHSGERGLVPWTAVSEISVRYIRGTPIAALVPRDWQAFDAKLTPFERKTLQLNTAFNLDQGLAIGVTHTTLAPGQVIAILAAFAKANGVGFVVK